MRRIMISNPSWNIIVMLSSIKYHIVALFNYSPKALKGQYLSDPHPGPGQQQEQAELVFELEAIVNGSALKS